MKRTRSTVPGNVAARLRRLARLRPPGDPLRAQLEAAAAALERAHPALTTKRPL